MLLMPHPVSSSSSESASCGAQCRAAAASDRVIVGALRLLGDVVLGIGHIARADHERLVGNRRLIDRAVKASAQAAENRPLRLVQEAHLHPVILVLLDT